MKLSRLIVLLLTGAAAVGAAVYLLQEDDRSVEASLSVSDALGADTAGYKRADEMRSFNFPADHGPHPAFKTEWWYLTGNLQHRSGRRFGYQLTIFRVAMAPPQRSTAESASDWAADQIYMGHFTVTDAAGGSFTAFERFSRGAAGLAGAQAVPFRVWLEDWVLEGTDDSLFPLRIQAREDERSIDLELRPVKERVLQGDAGLDRKGPGEGNASYYYSYPRLQTEGVVTVGDRQYTVDGLSWMDREWSTSALGPDQAGWDWFALHLSNGADLMYYQIRRNDGTPGAYSNGVLVGREGEITALERDDLQLDVLDTWRSSVTGIEYPAQWRLRVPDRGLDLTISPVLPDQELDVSVRYWEGAVAVEGRAGSEPIDGEGYVELTGYAGSGDGGANEGYPGGISGRPPDRVEDHLGDLGIFVVGHRLAGL